MDYKKLLALLPIIAVGLKIFTCSYKNYRNHEDRELLRGIYQDYERRSYINDYIDQTSKGMNAKEKEDYRRRAQNIYETMKYMQDIEKE